MWNSAKRRELKQRKDMFQTKYAKNLLVFAYFFIAFYRKGVLLFNKWRKVVDDGAEWWIMWQKVVHIPKLTGYLFTGRGVFYVHGRIQSHS